MHNKTIASLAKSLQSREFSAVELTQYFLERIENYNPLLNSYITVTKEHALAAAQYADNLLAQNNANILTGIPISHKDIFCTQGIKTSCGSKMLDNFVAPYNATIVKKLISAGTAMLGKLNMDEFAMGSSNENSFYGPVKNPWNLHCVPGGSSGGSASAVAAGLAVAATGSDTGGSIRQPASFCGITGIKPTYGRVSRYGMVAFASSLDQAGIMAKYAEDAAYLLNAIAGFDHNDSTSVKGKFFDFTATLNNSLENIKVGIVQSYLQKLDTKVASVILSAAKELEKLGATLVDIELPHSDAAISAYYVIAPAECSANLARFDGVRYGYRCKDPKNLQDLYERSRAEGFGSEVKHRILIGTYVLSSGFYNAYYCKAQQIRRLVSNDYQNAFRQADVILGPTTPTTAFALASKTAERVDMYNSDIFTVPVNLAGLPAMSIPAGFVDAMPVGVHLTGNYLQEAQLLNVAHRFQQVTDWHLRVPQGF